ncbi:MAG TPA: hypothetical protein VN742_05875 [Candidatus Binataceae bacterium]|nr:hypothetical protein [Candidatus Binataceae bacterium]
MKTWLLIPLTALAAGCFYPPQLKPPPNRTSVIIDIPYDLAWDDVQTVVADNLYRVITSNPNVGTLEAQKIGGFTLDDADCGNLRGIGGKVKAEPDPDASVVYDFHVAPKTEHASVVSVEATFTAPLHVPLHPITDEQCVSRGVQEARLLDQIRRQSLLEHRSLEHVDLRKTAP